MRDPERPLGDNATNPPDDWWASNGRDLMAMIYDGIQVLIWQNGGGKGPRPKPLRRAAAKQRGPKDRVPTSRAVALLNRSAPPGKGIPAPV